MVANRKMFTSLMIPGVDHLPHTLNLSQMAFSKGQPTWGAHLADELEKIVALQDANTIAAVILEPVQGSTGVIVPPEGYLQKIREICTKHGILLIFDEVITGFRLGFCGAAGLFDVHPDIITYGKILGGGLPVGAYGASSEIMRNISPEGNVYQAGTLSGNPVAMSAGIAQLSACLRDGFYEDLEAKTQYLVKGIQAVNTFSLLKIVHVGSIFWLAFTDKNAISDAAEIDPASMQYFRTLYHSLLENGIYMGPSGYEVGFVSAAHSYEDLDKTISAFENSLKKLS
jgi:glutamate-1-semialdehyde 2,1-aminomutase